MNMLYFCTFLSLLQLLFLCTFLLHLGPVQATQASQVREESLTHIWRINSWWASGLYASSTRSPALLLFAGWWHRGLCIKHCLFRKTTMWRDAWPYQGVNRSAQLTRVMCLLHESPGRVSLPAQPSLGTVSGRCHLLQFEVLLPQFT